MKTFIKLLSLLALVSSSLLFGATSELIKPKDTKQIVDIGFKNPSTVPETVFQKEMVMFPSMIREVDHIVDNMQRIHNPIEDCEIDELGHENCPTNSKTCDSYSEYSAGYSIKHSSVRTVKLTCPKPTDVLNPITGICKTTIAVNTDFTESFCTDHYTRLLIKRDYSDPNYIVYILASMNPGGGVDGRCGYQDFSEEEASAYGLTGDLRAYHKAKRLYVGSQVTGINSYTINFSSSGEGCETMSGSITGQISGPGYFGSTNLTICPAGSAQIPSVRIYGTINYETTTQVTCPSTFISDGTGNCRKEYSWYSYKCDTVNQNVYGQHWNGPVLDTGEDCLGQCGPFGCVCNSSTPPSKNCVRGMWTCPTNPNQLCSRTTESGESVDNIFNGFIYDNGSSEKNVSVVIKEKNCMEGGIYNATSDKCEHNVIYSCMINTFSYAKDLDSCIKPLSCDGVYNQLTGICETEPTHTCEQGYTYNKNTLKCEKQPICDIGTYNMLTDKCEVKPDSTMCTAPYTFNTATNRCEKAIETTNYYCPPSLGVMNPSTGKCDLVPPLALKCKGYLDAGGNDSTNGKGYSNIVNPGESSYTGIGEAGRTSTYSVSYSYVPNSNLLSFDSNCNITIGTWGTLIPVGQQKSINGVYVSNQSYSYQPPVVSSDPVCPTGYTENIEKHMCYLNDSGIEDFDKMKTSIIPTCPLGTFDSTLNICSFNPTCANNGIFNTTTDTCQLNVTNSCAPNQGNLMSSTNISGTNQTCATNTLTCQTGSWLEEYETSTGPASYCTTTKTPVCDIGQVYNTTTEKCESEPFCDTGFLAVDGKCKRNYTFFTYLCPTGFESPIDDGGDCLGSCGDNGCYCNTQIPPANNCRKAFNLNSSVTTITKKRDLITHTVTPSKSGLTPDEFNKFKNYDCGDQCLYNVNKIYGIDNSICFSKFNGEKECFKVDGCSFKGTIEDKQLNAGIGGVESKKIKDLTLIDQNTLILTPYNGIPKTANDEDMKCPGEPGSMTYNPTTKMCEGIANYYQWSQVGDNGDWTIKNSGTELYQSVNGQPTFFVSNAEYGSAIFEGKMKTDDTDDDYFGMVFGWKGSGDFFAIDWKKATQLSMKKGLRLIKIKDGNYGSSTTPGITIGLSSYGTPVDTSSVDILASDFNYPGYQKGVWYNIKVMFTKKTFILFIDNVEALRYDSDTDIFPESGKIGFLNVSQAKVSYKDFFIQAAPLCPDGYSWNPEVRVCKQLSIQTDSGKIESTCKMNGHVGWHSRTEGIVSIVAENDRLKFWDSYKDKDLGFIEFVKDISPQDANDGFVPQNLLPYTMLAQNFTGIDSFSGSTYFVSGPELSTTTCNQYAAKNGLVVADPNIVNGLKPTLKKLSGNRFEQIIKKPECEGGFLLESENVCLKNPSAGKCVAGKYDLADLSGVTSPSSFIRENGVWNNETGDSATISGSVLLFAPGPYIISIESLGDSALYIDKSIVLSAYKTSKTITYFLNSGFHTIDIYSQKSTGSKAVGFTIMDGSGRVITSSRDWCKQSSTVQCPEDGFHKVGDLCLEKTLVYCESGIYNPDLGTCILDPKCVLAKNAEMNFSDQNISIKVEERTEGPAVYKCSPLTCKDHRCQTVDCVSGYFGNIHNSYENIPLGSCEAQQCDGFKPYYEYCGREGGCDKTNNLVFENNGNCYEKYCADGVMNTKTGMCEKLACPTGTVLNIDGKCVKK